MMYKLKRFRFNAIKESFDRLPTAVCFFDRSGGIVLCNRQMYRLSQYLLNSDLQYLEELQKALASPPKGIMYLTSPRGAHRFCCAIDHAALRAAGGQGPHGLPVPEEPYPKW